MLFILSLVVKHEQRENIVYIFLVCHARLKGMDNRKAFLELVLSMYCHVCTWTKLVIVAFTFSRLDLPPRSSYQPTGLQAAGKVFSPSSVSSSSSSSSPGEDQRHSPGFILQNPNKQSKRNKQQQQGQQQHEAETVRRRERESSELIVHTGGWRGGKKGRGLRNECSAEGGDDGCIIIALSAKHYQHFRASLLHRRPSSRLPAILYYNNADARKKNPSSGLPVRRRRVP